MYCVNENKDATAHFAFFFNFSFCHSFITHMDVFCQSFLSNYLIKDYEILCTLSGRQVYCVFENEGANPHFAFFFQIFDFSFCHSYMTHMDIFHQSFLGNYLI